MLIDNKFLGEIKELSCSPQNFSARLLIMLLNAKLFPHGHVRHSVCYLFITRGGTIVCEIAELGDILQICHRVI